MTERPDVLNNQAILLAGDGDYPSAIECFKRAIIIERDNYLLWYNLGVTYKDSGDNKNAIDALKRAHQLAPDNIDITETLATLYVHEHKLSAATDLCDEGLKENPFESRLWNLMGVVLFNKELFKDASECFENAVSINPMYMDALYNLRDTYEELKNNFGKQECEKKIKELMRTGN